MNDLVLPKQEEHGGYAQDSNGGNCNSTMFCGAIDIMKKFAATGMNDLVLSKQEEHGGYAQDSNGGNCNSTMFCGAIDIMKKFAATGMNKMKDFVTDITKNRKCKPDALVLIERYGNLL